MATGTISNQMFLMVLVLMQPSIGTFSSPSSKIRLRCINFEIEILKPHFCLNVLNLYLVKFEAQ